MTSPNDPDGWAPKRPVAVAVALFAAAALTLCWPMLTGQWLAGPWSDQFEAGYSFRHFAALYFRQHHAIPLWNPYLFGGLPYVGAAHGDIFYPTAWLRWFLPTDTGMNLGFALHLVVAGWGMYGLMRTLGASWSGAVIGGLGYELTGIVVSLVHPGHDGKLFVSAMAPILFMGIVHAVRDRRLSGYATMALTTGLALQGHPQTSYYLMVAAAIWGALWVFGPDGPAGAARWRVILGAVGAVGLGVGLYAVYALPMAEYVPYSPRAEGGVSTGWEHATSFSLPPEELLGVVLPQIDGMVTPTYFGRNGLRLHSEYLGPVLLILAVIGMAGSERRRTRLAMLVIGATFLLVSLGGHTPFFRLWYAVMPMTGRLRAPGQAFFLVAMPLAYFAGTGIERLLRGEAARARLAWTAGIVAVLALLGVVGVLQAVSEDIGRGSGLEGFAERAVANAPALRLDSLRLLAMVLAGATAVWLTIQRKLAGVGAVAVIGLALWADLWFVGRRYFVFSPPARETFAPDPIMQRLQATKEPYRVFAPSAALGDLNPYPRSWLMAAGIPTVFGYHGNQLRDFDELWGGKEIWRNQLNPGLWQLFAVRYVLLSQPQDVPGFRQVMGPIETRHGKSYLYEADTVPPYARVLTTAAKVPDSTLAATAGDPRFPVTRLAIYPDTASVNPAKFDGQMPAPSQINATVSGWEPGRIKVSLTGASANPEYLVIAENWYRDWRVTVDGKPAPLLRAQNTLLSVVIPPGAKEAEFVFDSPSYRTGRTISLASLVAVLALFGWPLVAGRKRADG